MVSYSIKTDDETDETESPNLVNKIGLAKRKIVSKIFYNYNFLQVPSENLKHEKQAFFLFNLGCDSGSGGGGGVGWEGGGGGGVYT